MADLVGVSLTTQEIRNITSNIKSISADMDVSMKNFQSCMQTLTGQAEGGLIDQTVTAGQQLFDGVMQLSKCFLNLGLKIGDYLNMMIRQDSNMAAYLREQIEK